MSGLFDQITNYSPPLLTAGQVNYKGTWDAATNTPTLVSPPAAISKGDYYVVSTAGTQFSISFAVGDWIISNGTAWEKVDLTDAVSSVFGRTGAVVGVSTDYSSVGLTNTAIGASSPSTGAFTTVTASSTIAATGAVTGSNLSGTNTGDQTNITGNSGTATALQTARAINGVNFDGTAAITVTAAGSTLSDTVTIAKGGTGQITAQAALNALLPSQAGASGKNLQSDGTNVSFVADAGGTVTSVSVSTANGVSGTVATSTTTPAISLTLGAITPTSVAASGSVTGSNLSGTNTGDQTISITGDVTAAGSTGVLTASVTKINGTSLAGLTTGLLKNTTTTGVPTIAVSGTDYAPPTSGTAILYGNNAGGFNNVTVGSGLSFSSGTLASTSAGGSVTSVSVTTANGVSGTVTNPSSTPDISITLGAITPSSVNSVVLSGSATPTLAVTGTSSISGTSSGTNTGDQTTITGNAGSATVLQTPRAIYGNNFDGSAALTQVIASTYGGTGNGFAKFSGPASSEKTFTLPNASSTLLYEGGTIGATTANTGAFTTLSSTGNVGIKGAQLSVALNMPNAEYIAWFNAGVTGSQDAAVRGSGGNLQLFGGGANSATVTSTGLNSTAIGATTASTGAFTTLTASGGITNTQASTASINNVATGASSTSRYFASAPTTGTGYLLFTDTTLASNRGYVGYTFATDTLDIATAGAVRGTFSSTGLAVTGTGTFNVSATNPVVISRASDATGYGILSFNNVFTAGGMLGPAGGGGIDSALYLNSPTGGSVVSRVNAVAISTVTSTGLAVTGALSASGTTTVGPNNAGTGLALLQLFGGSGTNGGASVYFGTNGTAYSSIGQLSGIIGGTSTDLTLYANNGGQNIKFYAGGGGLISTISSTGLAVTGNTKSTFPGSTGGSAGYGFWAQDSTDASGAGFAGFAKASGTVIGSITRVGTTDAVVYNTTSDARLKENLRDFTDSGRLIDSLKPRVFDWKNSDENGKNVVGFVAQEEHAADPIFAHIGAVSVGDEDADTITKQWQRSDSALIPILVAELKALRQRVAALESN